jgi:hypothetical protein
MGLFKKREPGEDVTQPKGAGMRGAIGQALLGIGHAFPKGIRLPDDTVRNAHLYMGTKKGQQKPKTRLF